MAMIGFLLTAEQRRAVYLAQQTRRLVADACRTGPEWWFCQEHAERYPGEERTAQVALDVERSLKRYKRGA